MEKPPEQSPEEKPEVPRRRLQPQGTPGDSQTSLDAPHGIDPIPDRSDATPDDAPQRRKERGAAAGGANEPNRHREEVAGQGYGETAGGSPATARGDNAAAEQSLHDAAIAFDPVILSGGGGLSNTPPQETTLGGEDYLTVNFYLQYECYDSTRHLLNDAKERAAKDRCDSQLQLGDVCCLVGPAGVALGSGAKALYATWRLKTEHGVTLLIVDRAEPHATQISRQARATSLTMMRLGFSTVLGLMHYLIDRLGADIIRNKLSRVDPCIDLAGVPIEGFSEPFHAGHYVSRAKKKRGYFTGQPIGEYATGADPSGFSVGVSPLVVNVYDKVREVTSDPVKIEVLATSRWNGYPENATRVELQLSRGKLKRLGIDSVEDWIEKRPDAIERVLTDSFRLTDGPVDRKHASRDPTHPVWLAVQTAFQECYGRPVGADLAPLPPMAVDPLLFVAGGVGQFKTMFAVTGASINNNDDFLREQYRITAAYIHDRDMADEVARRGIEKGIAGLGIG